MRGCPALRGALQPKKFSPEHFEGEAEPPPCPAVGKLRHGTARGLPGVFLGLMGQSRSPACVQSLGRSCPREPLTPLLFPHTHTGGGRDLNFGAVPVRPMRIAPHRREEEDKGDQEQREPSMERGERGPIPVPVSPGLSRFHEDPGTVRDASCRGHGEPSAGSARPLCSNLFPFHQDLIRAKHAD